MVIRGSLISARTIVFCVIGAVVLSWPMLIVSAPLVFPDTENYIHQGGDVLNSLLRMVLSEQGVERLSAALGIEFSTPAGSDLRVDAEDSASRSVRSAAYSVFLHVTTHAPLHPVLPALMQSFAILLMLLAVIPREIHAPRAAIWGTAFAAVLLTSWPWYASYLMPDILAAGVLLYAAWLVRGVEGFGRAEKWVLCSLATGCVLSHYGNIPVAVAVLATALGILALGRRLRVEHAVLAAVPVVLAVAVNVIAGVILYDGASAVPRRLPILLARSIEDGPARWHLEERCRTGEYRICEIYGEEGGLPDNVGDLLWAKDGLRTVGREEMQEIREQEIDILLGAFRDYPLRQAASFLRNGGRQFTMLGTNEIWPAEITVDQWGTLDLEFDRDRLKGMLSGFGRLHAVTFWAGLAVLLGLGWRDGWRGTPHEREVLVVIAMGLVVNAFVFGGLSAPADRYQARIAWLVPVMAAVLVLARFSVTRGRQRSV